MTPPYDVVTGYLNTLALACPNQESGRKPKLPPLRLNAQGVRDVLDELVQHVTNRDLKCDVKEHVLPELLDWAHDEAAVPAHRMAVLRAVAKIYKGRADLQPLMKDIDDMAHAAIIKHPANRDLHAAHLELLSAILAKAGTNKRATGTLSRLFKNVLAPIMYVESRRKGMAYRFATFSQACEKPKVVIDQSLTPHQLELIVKTTRAVQKAVPNVVMPEMLRHYFAMMHQWCGHDPEMMDEVNEILRHKPPVIVAIVETHVARRVA